MTRLRSCGSSGARDPSVCGSARTTAQPLHVWGPAQLRSVSKQSWLVRLRGLHEWAGCPMETHGRGSWAQTVQTILGTSALDVTVDNNSEASFKKQAKYYADVMKILIAHSDQFEAVQVWGLTDMMSWRGSQYPLLFDGRGNPKPAFWAVADPDSVQ